MLDPATALKDPGVQFVHWLTEAFLKLPAVHWTHEVERS